jgi:hypothetical protein
LHFADGLLLGEIADGAGVEEDDIGEGLGGGEGIALGDELGGDRLAVALVHLAPVGFDEDGRHDVAGERIKGRGMVGKRNSALRACLKIQRDPVFAARPVWQGATSEHTLMGL